MRSRSSTVTRSLKKMRKISPTFRQHRSLSTSSVRAEPTTNVSPQKNEHASLNVGRSVYRNFPKRPIGGSVNGHIHLFSSSSNVSYVNRKFSSSRTDEKELMNKEDHAHCVDLVQTRDYEGYCKSRFNFNVFHIFIEWYNLINITFVVHVSTIFHLFGSRHNPDESLAGCS